MRELVIVGGVFLAAYALRTFSSGPLRRLGSMTFLAGSYLAGWFLFGSHLAGALFVAAWFLLPWVEILLRIRRLDLPLEKNFRSRHAPPRAEFPHLGELTEEMEGAGFSFVDDLGWDWESLQQFIRLFVHEEQRWQGAVHLHQQQGVGISFVSLSTRTKDGRLWTTWNYPYVYTMKLAPGFELNRAESAESLEALVASHESFLASRNVETSEVELPDPELLPQQIEKELRRQIDHNLDEGILRLSGQGYFRYSWRGCFFLWREFIKAMVRQA